MNAKPFEDYDMLYTIPETYSSAMQRVNKGVPGGQVCEYFRYAGKIQSNME